MPAYKALLSGDSWNATPTLRDMHAPVFLTYSFPVEKPLLSYWNEWAAFSDADRDLARYALKQWGDASGITFLETRGDASEIKFSWLESSPDVTAYAEFPELDRGSFWDDRDDLHRSYNGGNVYLNTLAYDELSQNADYKLYVLLHEIGHALGLKHPFHQMDHNGQLLGPELDHVNNTVMSYTGREAIGPGHPIKLGFLDIQAIYALYGAPSADGRQVASWKWQASKETLTQKGKPGADKLYGTAVKDVIKGQAGNDRLYGFDGNDTLHGGTGKDVLVGGYGEDKFVFDTALDGVKNVDKIVDFDSDFGFGGDQIVLSSLIFPALPKGRLAYEAFEEGDHAHTADVRIIFDSWGDRGLFYDPDGSGPLAQIKFARFSLTNKITIDESSFYIV